MNLYIEILGAKHPDALGSAGHKVWPEIWDVIGPMLGRVLNEGEATRAQDLLLPLRRYGYDEECYFSFSYSPIRDESGGVGGVFCPVIETTERVIGERRLHLLGAIAEQTATLNTPDEACATAAACLQELGRHDFPFSAIYLVDEEGECARLAGTVRLDHDGSGCPAILRFDTPEGTLLSAAIAGSAESVLVDNPGAFFADLAGGAGGRSPGPVALLPLGAGGARPAGFMLAGLNPHRPAEEMCRFAELVAGHIATAVVKARAYQEERRQAEALAELDRAKTAFFSNVSHEFRTPLTLMLGPLREIAGKADATPLSDLRDVIEMATRNALRLQRMVSTLLDFSRMEAGRLRARFRRVDLVRLTLDLASNFEAPMQRVGLGFSVSCDRLSQPVYVDPEMWERIVLNLLSNALKFTLDGDVRLELTERDGAAVLFVRDSGIGIAAEHLPHVFERFHRVEGLHGRSHEGTGIGLALVSDLARLHGGEAWVESVPGQGSVFAVRVPFGRAHLPADQVTEEAIALVPGPLASAFLEEVSTWIANDASGSEAADTGQSAGSNDPTQAVSSWQDTAGQATILLADDNADMRAYIRRLLEAAGHRVVAVVDGAAALDQLHACSPDLVLTDIMMPRLDGLGLVRAIRRDVFYQEVPIILLSARAGEEAQIAGLETAADDYLIKPFAARELLARVKSNLVTARLRRHARDELRAMNEILEQRIAERTAERDRLWELSEDLLALADYEGHFLRLSPSWTRLLGFDKTVLLFNTFATVIHPDDVTRSMAYVHEMRRFRQPVRFENRLRTADGGHRWMSWVLSPGSDGETLIASGRDITQEKAAQDELLEANRELRAQITERERVEAELLQMQRLEAVGQLTSGVAHDFNNLLTIILGALELLERDPQHRSMPRMLAMIRSAAKRGATLTAQLLAFARKQRLNPLPLDLNEAIVGMSDLLRGTLGGTVRLETVLKPDLWPALVDRGQLELVVLNLAINARDAMPVGGGLTIETANVTLGPAETPHDPVAGDYVMVSVTDVGTGMPPDVVERAFEPFFTTKEPGKGSGLGLAQVYGFAKQSGGGIRIETQVGKGTSIRVFLPCAAAQPGVAVGDASMAGIAAESGKPRVLLVDDDADVREITMGMLEALGYDVTPAASGLAALALAEREGRFDLCVFDFAMPGMNGVELSRRIEARFPGIPMVFVTGYADMKALAEIGGRPVVMKPFKPENLAATLRDAIKARRGSANVVPFQRNVPAAR